MQKNQERFDPVAGTMQSVWDTCLEVVPRRAEWSRELLSGPRRETWTGARLGVRLGVVHLSESSKCCGFIPVCSAIQEVCES